MVRVCQGTAALAPPQGSPDFPAAAAGTHPFPYERGLRYPFGSRFATTAGAAADASDPGELSHSAPESHRSIFQAASAPGLAALEPGCSQSGSEWPSAGTEWLLRDVPVSPADRHKRKTALHSLDQAPWLYSEPPVSPPPAPASVSGIRTRSWRGRNPGISPLRAAPPRTPPRCCPHPARP